MFVKNDNYKAWDISISDFPKKGTIEEKIAFFLKYAILAPSTFNSQPWKCRVSKNVLELYLDLRRIPQKSDKTRRFAYISLGCFLANLILASENFGFQTQIDFVKDIKGLNPWGSTPIIQIASIVFKKTKPIFRNNDLFLTITHRFTNRALSLNKEIPSFVFEELKKYVKQDQAIILLGEKERERLIQISQAADYEIWGDFEFRKEHVGWVRNNATKQYDGMPGFGVGVKLIPSFFAYPMILSPFFPAFQVNKNKRSLKSSKYFITVCGKENKKNWIEGGILYEYVCLYLNSQGIATAPMGQFIENDEARTSLQKLTQKYSKYPPQLFCRIGYPSQTQIYHSPRLPVEYIFI